MKKYEFLEHTADIKFKLQGKSLNEIFENCALAFSKIIGRENKINSVIKKKIEVVGNDNESLLYGFIDELIYLLDTEDFVVSKTDVRISDFKLEAELSGDSAVKYKGLDHVKSATYAEMYVKEISKGNWEAQVVVDV